MTGVLYDLFPAEVRAPDGLLYVKVRASLLADGRFFIFNSAGDMLRAADDVTVVERRWRSPSGKRGARLASVIDDGQVYEVTPSGGCGCEGSASRAALRKVLASS